MSRSLVRLPDIAEINPRRSIIERDDNALTAFVPMEAVDDICGKITRIETLPYRKLKKGYTHFREGDVIFAKITPCMQNGKHAVVRNLLDGFGFGSTEFHVIRASERVLPEWIHYFLRRKETLDAAVKTFTGTVGQQRVPHSFLEDLELPLPTLEEQRRIASHLKAKLAEVEAVRKPLRDQWRELWALKNKMLDAAFDNLPNWQPIGNVAKLQSGYAFKSEAFKQSGVRLLRNANITPGNVYWDDTVYLSEEDAQRFQAYELVAGDVLISLDRPIISSGIKVARVCESDLPALLLQRVGRFLLDADQLEPDYLFAFLQTNHFMAKISGHEQSLGVPHISPGQVEAVEIPLPDLVTQRQLAQQLTQIFSAWSTAVAALKRQLDEVDILPQRLLAQAFEN